MVSTRGVGRPGQEKRELAWEQHQGLQVLVLLCMQLEKPSRLAAEINSNADVRNLCCKLPVSRQSLRCPDGSITG